MVKPRGRTTAGLQMKQKTKTVIQNEEQRNVNQVKKGAQCTTKEVRSARPYSFHGRDVKRKKAQTIESKLLKTVKKFTPDPNTSE
jgi:hypothetical protein